MLVRDNRCGVGVTPQHAEVVVPAALAIDLLVYPPLDAHPSVIVFAGFVLSESEDPPIYLWNLKLVACVRSSLQHSSKGPRCSESYQYPIPVLEPKTPLP